MPGLTNQIAAALAADAATGTGAVGGASTPVDHIPDTPFVYVGPPKLSQVPGSWELREYRFPLHYLIARVGAGEAADQVVINDALDLVLNVFRAGITLGGLAGLVSALIIAADTDKFYALGGADYQSIDFDVLVTVMGPGGYTP